MGMVNLGLEGAATDQLIAAKQGKQRWKHGRWKLSINPSSPFFSKDQFSKSGYLSKLRGTL